MSLGIDNAARARQKLFSRKILVNKTTYTHISQKFLKGLAARIMIFWITPTLYQKAVENPQDVHQVQLGFALFVVVSWVWVELGTHQMGLVFCV